MILFENCSTNTIRKNKAPYKFSLCLSDSIDTNVALTCGAADACRTGNIGGIDETGGASTIGDNGGTGDIRGACITCYSCTWCWS